MLVARLAGGLLPHGPLFSPAQHAPTPPSCPCLPAHDTLEDVTTAMPHVRLHSCLWSTAELASSLGLQHSNVQALGYGKKARSGMDMWSGTRENAGQDAGNGCWSCKGRVQWDCHWIAVTAQHKLEGVQICCISAHQRLVKHLVAHLKYVM